MPVIEITSLTHPGVDVFSTLTEAQLRNRLDPQRGIFIAESPKVIRVALEAGYEPVSLLCERKHLTGDAEDLVRRMADLPVYTGDRDLLARLTGYTLTRGVLCAMRRPAFRTVEEVCRGARRWWLSTGWSIPPTSEPFSVRQLHWASMPCCSHPIRVTR